jgi:AcrR family transcriptional regulator
MRRDHSSQAATFLEAENSRLDHIPHNDKQDAHEKGTRELIVKVATRIFREIGFHKTTVADIAREMHMSPANVYRFFNARAEIIDAVCADLLSKIEAEAQIIAASQNTATQNIIDLVKLMEAAYYKQFQFDRNLYDLIKEAITENWRAMGQHATKMTAIFEQIILSGMESGEFRRGDPTLAARLFQTAFTRFCDPRLIVEHGQQGEPTIDQMMDLCINGVAPRSN